MKTISLLLSLTLVLLISCTSIPNVPHANTTPISTKTTLATQVIIESPVSDSDRQQSIFRVGEFSKDYYGIVQVESTSEVFKKGWIAVYDKKTDKELIKVSSGKLAFDFHDRQIKANILELPYGEQSLIIYDDFNFDGIKDFAIQDGQNSCYGLPSFQIYLSQNNELILSKDFTRLAQEYCGMFQVDQKEQKIYTMQKTGCCWHQYSDFFVSNNIPVIQKIVEVERFSPYLIVVTKEWIDGKLTETKEKHLSWEDIKDYSVVSFDIPSDGGKVYLFSFIGETLVYAATTKDGIVKINYPLEKTAVENAQFSYINEHPNIVLQFTDKNIEYEVYEVMNGNTIDEIGVRITTDGQTVTLEGDVATIQGNLLDIEKVKWNNVVIDK
jgi:hypothetical protein